MSKKYTTNFLEDTNGSTGSANQVLISTPSGIDWVDGSGSGIIGGPYLPLAGGTMTGTIGFSYSGTNANYIEQANSGFGYGRITPFSNSGLFAFDTNYTDGGGYDFKYNGSSIIRITSGGSVGIGTTSPSNRLDVIGGASVTALRVGSSASGEGIIRHYSTGGQGIGIVTGALNASGIGLYVSHGTNNRNVGIGTTSPLGRFQVNEYTVASQGNQNIHGELSVFANSGDESLFLGIKDAAYPNRGWAFNPIISGVNCNLQFKEHGATSVRMTIGSGGNVGIGTTSPAEKLDVNGNINIRSTASGIRGIKRPDDGYNLHLAGGSSLTGGSYIEVNGGSRGGVGNALNGEINFVSGGSYQSSQSAVVGNYNFKTQWNGGSATLMHIDSSTGNVGIGTTSPSFKLDVTGDGIRNVRSTAGWAGWFENTNNSSGVIVTAGVDSGDAPLLIRKQDGTELFSVRGNGTSWFNNGNVGIGNTAPGTKLHVGSGSGATVDTGYQMVIDSAGIAGLQILSATTQSGRIVFGDSGDNDIGMIKYDHTDNSMGFRTNGSGNEWMRIASGGNVGIGTTSPSANLQVAGTVRYNTQLSTSNNSGQKAFIGISSGSGAQKFKIYKNTNTTDGYARFTVDRAYDYGNNEQMVQEAVFQRRNTAKNFVFKYEGDRATADDVYLEVYELSNGQVEIWLCVDDFAQPVVEVISNPGTSEIFTSPSAGTPTGTLIHSSNPDTETPNWDSYQGDGYFAGNVGIGETSPSSKLHVKDTSLSGTLAYFEASASAQGTTNVRVDCLQYGSGIAFFRDGTLGNGACSFRNDSGTQVGSITIGTTSTAYNTISDYRLKENLTLITDGIDRLKQLKPKRFNFIGETQTVDGFVAHEAKQVVPESVTGEKDKVLLNGDPVYQGIDQSKIVPLLTAALQEAVAKIEDLENRIQTLENK